MNLKSPTFAQKLSAWRANHRFSIKEAATILDAPTNTVIGWEYRGKQPAKTCLNCLLKKMEEYKE